MPITDRQVALIRRYAGPGVACDRTRLDQIYTALGDPFSVALELIEFTLSELAESPAKFTATGDATYDVTANLQALETRAKHIRSILKSKAAAGELTPAALEAAGIDVPEARPDGAFTVLNAGRATGTDGR